METSTMPHSERNGCNGCGSCPNDNYRKITYLPITDMQRKTTVKYIYIYIIEGI